MESGNQIIKKDMMNDQYKKMKNRVNQENL